MEVIFVAIALPVTMLFFIQLGDRDFTVPSNGFFDWFGFWTIYNTSRAETELKCMVVIGVAAVVLLSLYVYLKAISQPVAQVEAKPVAIAQKKSVRSVSANRHHATAVKKRH